MTKLTQPTESTINKIFDSTDRNYLEGVIGDAGWCNDDSCSCHQSASYARERLDELNGSS